MEHSEMHTWLSFIITKGNILYSSLPTYKIHSANKGTFLFTQYLYTHTHTHSHTSTVGCYMFASIQMKISEVYVFKVWIAMWK